MRITHAVSDEASGSLWGYYDEPADTIVIFTACPLDQIVSVLIHELAHAEVGVKAHGHDEVFHATLDKLREKLLP